MMTFNFRIFSAALLGVCVAASAIGQETPKDAAPAKRPATQVGADIVRTEPLSQTVPVIGRFVPNQAGQVAARVAGAVDHFLVEVGDQVEQGDQIAILVSNTFIWERNRRNAEVSNAKARLATSRSRLQLLDQEMKRLQGLKDSPAFSPARLNDKQQENVSAKSEVSESQAMLKAAEAELQLGKIALANTVIRAPYTGVIIDRHTEAGSYVREGDPMVTMLDHNNLEIEADVPANRISGLEAGRVLDANMAGGTNLRAIVRAVIPDENSRTRTRRVRFTSAFEGETMSTAANQTVTVLVPAGEIRDVLTVHKDAILNRGGAQLVVLIDDGKATFRPVKLGQAFGQRFVVLDGLVEGDEVVIRGNERLRPSQDITSGTPTKPKENPS